MIGQSSSFGVRSPRRYLSAASGVQPHTDASSGAVFSPANCRRCAANISRGVLGFFEIDSRFLPAKTHPPLCRCIGECHCLQIVRYSQAENRSGRRFRLSAVLRQLRIMLMDKTANASEDRYWNAVRIYATLRGFGAAVSAIWLAIGLKSIGVTVGGQELFSPSDFAIPALEIVSTVVFIVFASKAMQAMSTNASYERIASRKMVWAAWGSLACGLLALNIFRVVADTVLIYYTNKRLSAPLVAEVVE